MNPFLDDGIRESMVKSIQENFLGKVCTILTESSAIPFKNAMDHSQYYSGIMIGADLSGVWLKHPQNGTLSFFSYPLQGIVEEQYIAPGDPRHEKVKEEMAKSKVAPQVRQKPPQSATNQVISVDELSARLRASKKN